MGRIDEWVGQKVYILRDVERFLTAKNISPAKFGRECVGDPRFVFDLRRGRTPRPNTIRRVQSFLEQAK